MPVNSIRPVPASAGAVRAPARIAFGQSDSGDSAQAFVKVDRLLYWDPGRAMYTSTPQPNDAGNHLALVWDDIRKIFTSRKA